MQWRVSEGWILAENMERLLKGTEKLMMNFETVECGPVVDSVMESLKEQIVGKSMIICVVGNCRKTALLHRTSRNVLERFRCFRN